MPRLRGLPAMLCILCILCIPSAAMAQQGQVPPEMPQPSPSPSQTPAQGHGELAEEPLVDVAKVDPTIVIDLRYATARNITGHPIYPPGTLCLLRSGVAARLKEAQTYLHALGYSLKIWDAYRPSRAQQILWDLVQNPEVVAQPSKGGSRHSWGVAVDVTLVDLAGQDVPMPTDFDDFTAAAKSQYTGNDPIVAKNLSILKSAMEITGFEGMRDEWWHYSAKNWRSYKAIVTLDMQLGKQPPGAAGPSPIPGTSSMPTITGSPAPATGPGETPAAPGATAAPP
jgi:D-alanyl-D-alanine dipeptidase